VVNRFEFEKRGQVTIFVIIAILIFAVILAFITLKGNFSTVEIPVTLEPVYANFLSCLEQDVETGIALIETQAGYIELPEFEQGSKFSPFSSQLNFLGNPIPYWYYVSGNNIEKTQVPLKTGMEKELGKFIDARLRDCEFEVYRDQGFEISLGVPKTEVRINDNEVDILLEMDLEILKDGENVVVAKHEIVVDSGLGGLYKSAKEIYNAEQDEFFLEEYGIDTLRLYAPVDGEEISCSPLVWNAEEVFDELQDAIEVNTLALGTNRKEEYYNIDFLSTGNHEVRFVNSRSWPYAIEVNPSEDQILTASPIGNQPGLNLLGFCYVPYHFVYNVKYPVLIQVQDRRTEEVFQFPMAVVIEGNKPREALSGSGTAVNVDPELCKYKNTESRISSRNREGGIVNTEISYECFGQKCNIGQTEGGVLEAEFPQCVNGYILARADGFKDARYLFSTVEQGSLEIILDKLYETQIKLRVDGVSYNGEAIITFTSGDDVKVIAYPGTKSVELGEGQYDVDVYLYSPSEINVGATVTEQCLSVPRSGVFGAFGLKEERCFDIEIPEQVISSALAGGGKMEIFISESDLQGRGGIEINVPGFKIPETIEQVQDNYNLFESSGLEVNFV